jgi:hypothetical protein
MWKEQEENKKKSEAVVAHKWNLENIVPLNSVENEAKYRNEINS